MAAEGLDPSILDMDPNASVPGGPGPSLADGGSNSGPAKELKKLERGTEKIARALQQKWRSEAENTQGFKASKDPRFLIVVRAVEEFLRTSGEGRSDQIRIGARKTIDEIVAQVAVCKQAHAQKVKDLENEYRALEKEMEAWEARMVSMILLQLKISPVA